MAVWPRKYRELRGPGEGGWGEQDNSVAEGMMLSVESGKEYSQSGTTSGTWESAGVDVGSALGFAVMELG